LWKCVGRESTYRGRSCPSGRRKEENTTIQVKMWRMGRRDYYLRKWEIIIALIVM